MAEAKKGEQRPPSSNGALLAAFLTLPSIVWWASCVSVLQAFTLVLLPAGFRKEYYLVSRWLFSLVHRPLLYLFEHSGSKVYLHGATDALDSSIGRDQSIILTNHSGNVDWLVGLLLLDGGGGIGCCKAIVKKSLVAVPFFGFIWWCVDFVFLKRSWKEDSAKLAEGYKSQHLYRQHGMPYCVTLMPEGTRITPKKLQESQAFAASKGLPRFEHVLCPRSKGLWSAVNGLQLDAIYDITVAEEGNGLGADMITMAKGQPTAIHLHIAKMAPKDVPLEEVALSSWLMARWGEKEALLQKFKEEGSFSSKECTTTQLKVTPAVRHTVIGALAWWLLCVFLFVGWCIRSGRTFLLLGACCGAGAFFAAGMAVVYAVHFKGHTDSPSKSGKQS